MAAGLPQVVSDASGGLEATGEDAIVVPFGNIAAYREAFARLVADPDERRRLGVAARRRANELFSIRAMVDPPA